jgi:hypothetical protein
VIGVRGGQHLRSGRAELAAPVDVLEPGRLVGGRVGAGPEAVGRAGIAAVDVATEDRGATGEQCRKLGALRVVAGDLNRRSCVQVCGADVDLRGHTEPAAPLEAGLCLEVLAFGTLDGRPGEHRDTEQPAVARSHAAEALAAVDHPREARVVPGPSRDPQDVPLARLVERDRIRACFTDSIHCLVQHGEVVAARKTRQAQVHLHQRVGRARSGHPRGRSAARQGDDQRTSTGKPAAAHARHDAPA